MDSRPTKPDGEKCFAIVLGHASLKHGMCVSTMDPKSCASLKCTNCDKKVHRFLNGVWDASVDYMFVRNFATNVTKLQQGLNLEPGASAYACQCKFVSLKENNFDLAEEFHWVCGGH